MIVDDVGRHLAFLASSWSTSELRDLRNRIGQRFENDVRGRVWIAERDAQYLRPDQGIDQLEIIDACLDAIEASELFILIDTGEYGSHLHVRGAPSESSFLELELFQAVLLSKPIHYVAVAGSSAPSPLLRLLSSLKSDVEFIETSSLAMWTCHGIVPLL